MPQFMPYDPHQANQEVVRYYELPFAVDDYSDDECPIELSVPRNDWFLVVSNLVTNEELDVWVFKGFSNFQSEMVRRDQLAHFKLIVDSLVNRKDAFTQAVVSRHDVFQPCPRLLHT